MILVSLVDYKGVKVYSKELSIHKSTPKRLVLIVTDNGRKSLYKNLQYYTKRTILLHFPIIRFAIKNIIMRIICA